VGVGGRDRATEGVGEGGQDAADVGRGGAI